MNASLAKTWLCALLAGVLWASATAHGGSPGGGFVVIVNPRTPVEGVDRSFLEDVFLKKVTRWPGDGSIRPVDQGPNSSIRRRLSEEVLGRSVEEVRSYWQQRIFSGRDVPPAELDSDAQVVSYILQHPGAIGYVSSGADVKGAKAISLR
jgi:ABC-type phosphate transport system substrate-binding protein